jgi:hypothetical protein
MELESVQITPATAAEKQLEKQKKINSTPSQTIPTLLIWLAYLAAVLIWRIIAAKSANNGEDFDLKYLVWVAGGATFAYMLGGHATDFIRNKALPSGIGEVNDIARYKALVYFWIAISLIGTVAYMKFNVLSIPHTDILTIAGFISVEYIAGNRANKIATQVCTTYNTVIDKISTE